MVYENIFLLSKTKGFDINSVWKNVLRIAIANGSAAFEQVTPIYIFFGDNFLVKSQGRFILMESVQKPFYSTCMLYITALKGNEFCNRECLLIIIFVI